MAATPSVLALCESIAKKECYTERDHTQITLNQLSLRNARIIVEQLAAQQGLSQKTFDAVVERTGGVRLFVEKFTRAMLESGIVIS